MVDFEKLIQAQGSSIHKVVDFDFNKDKLLHLNLTSSNTELTDVILNDTDLFSDWINLKISEKNARYAIGGYAEHRTIYARSTHFGGEDEPRRLHLGVDIWAPIGTPVYNFYDANVHGFANNDNFGDYGGTIILSYEIEGLKFNVLYGHLSLASLNNLTEGDFIPKGKLFATFGAKGENGYWPPHLHLQVIKDMQSFKGDYPGVCKFSERETYLANCPNANVILLSTFPKLVFNI